SEPKSENTLRIIYAGQPLPGDRESLFWMNVKAIPSVDKSHIEEGKAVPAMPSCSAGRWANNNEGMSMLFSPPLQRATLIQRYKRF
ncbi:fimbria/pilus periplasmic chaperone, partial [Salmonella enterica subsp. enterica serovar Kentucky]|nr:fimbria/pilus periplasmic chaperone [Salmonella enterica subsp. enterica serovar Kentucky]